MHRGRSSLLLLAAVLTASAAACEGGDAAPDAGRDPMATPDAEPARQSFAACRELESPTMRVRGLPARITGNLDGAGADLRSPESCAEVNAPFGAVSAGADAVIAVDGLTVGTTYTVRLDAEQDLSFYVVTGCSSMTGPTASECRLFVDASAGTVETGSFTATAEAAWIVVDQFSSRLGAASFAVDLYASECEVPADCDGASACVDHRCVGCVTSFDCTDPAAPVCDTASHTCRAGRGLCRGDDSRENGDDGPAGALALTATSSLPIGVSGRICNSPADETDFFRFDVTQPGEHWLFALAWLDAVDLDLVVYDAHGERVGLSRYLMPETIALTYLPVGRYYVSVQQVDAAASTTAITYAMSAARASGDRCTGAADCAIEYLTQVPRGACRAGACVRIDGAAQIKSGGGCDSQTDCAAGTASASFLFTADADQRSVCGNHCDADADCAGMGYGYVCTTYLPQNFCVQRCEIDDHCPVLSGVVPPFGLPWARYRCQTSTGRCVR